MDVAEGTGGEIVAELKRCPFCGSPGEVEHREYSGTWIVQCSNGECPASYMIGWDYETEEDAIDAWNRRVNEQWVEC